MVTSRGRTRVALLRLALCYSVVPLRINPYLTKIVRVCAKQSISQSISQSVNQACCICFRCEKPCQPDKYGEFCNKTCACNLEHSNCSSVDGSCNCSRDWTGVTCNEPCGGSLLFSNITVPCLRTCNCTVNGKCQQTTGKCM